jgi:hypothetical protein
MVGMRVDYAGTAEPVLFIGTSRMLRYFATYATWMMIVMLLSGCHQVEEPTVAEPNVAQSPSEELAEPQRIETEPLSPKPDEVELLVPEPNDVEVSTIAKVSEPNGVVPPVPGPNEVEVSAAEVPEPNEVEPKEILRVEEGPVLPEPNEPEPEVGQADAGDPNAVESSAPEPNETKASPAEPNEAPPVSRVAFHDKCADILREFVDEDGMVNYKALRRRRLDLKRLLEEFDALERSEYNLWSSQDKIAFWINAYNIQMLNIIVENYPIDASRILSIFWGPYSIRHIKGIWTDYKFIVMDEEFTLSEIEQRFFRRQFNDPRVFLALTRASLSSPPLRNRPYYGHKLDDQLDDQAERFLSSRRGFRIDRDADKVYLSALFEPKPSWYGREFVPQYSTDKKFKDQKPTVRSVLNFITKYIPEPDVSFLEVQNYTVEFMKYDWTLNDSSRKPY